MKRALIWLAACGGASSPATHYYQLAMPGVATARPQGPALEIEAFATEPPYDDDRIVYRTTPYTIDYYNYHRWSSSPGAQIGEFLERALEHSGEFSAVTHETGAPVVLRGRVIAIEEIDETRERWVGRIAIELSLADDNGKVLWTGKFEEREPLATRSPAGLARALTIALDRIARRAVPVVVDHAEARVASKR